VLFKALKYSKSSCFVDDGISLRYSCHEGLFLSIFTFEHTAKVKLRKIKLIVTKID